MVIFCFLEGSGVAAVVGLFIVQFGIDMAGGAEDGLVRVTLLAIATEPLGVSFRDAVPFK